MQHAAGYVLIDDVRGYAINQIPESVTESERAVALQAIDDALYGLMQVFDGVTGGLRTDDWAVELRTSVRLRSGDTVTDELDLLDGDGMCMGYHGWLRGDFGEDPVTED